MKDDYADLTTSSIQWGGCNLFKLGAKGWQHPTDAGFISRLETLGRFEKKNRFITLRRYTLHQSTTTVKKKYYKKTFSTKDCPIVGFVRAKSEKGIVSNLSCAFISTRLSTIAFAKATTTTVGQHIFTCGVWTFYARRWLVVWER